MNKPVFYTNPQSRGRIVHWMLEEIGLPYETVWLEYGTTMKSSDSHGNGRNLRLSCRPFSGEESDTSVEPC